MDFQHSEGIWRDFPELVPGVINAASAAFAIPVAVFDVTASSGLPELIAAVAEELHSVWSIAPTAAVLSQSAPRFAFQK